MPSEDLLLKRVGWNTDLPAWQIDIVIATKPPTQWTTRRNSLQGEDLWLSMTLRSFGPWMARLTRHDRLFSADWNAGGVFVESGQLRYRKMMKWPVLKGPEEFPVLVGELNTLFPPGLAREACITIPRVNSRVDDAAIEEWLSPVCDTIEFVGAGD